MKSVLLKKPYKEAITVVKKAAYRCGLNFEGENLSKGILEFYKSGNFLSYGNNIKVKITEEGSVVKIKTKSESGASIQLIDWGSNRKIEEDLIMEIRKITQK